VSSLHASRLNIYFFIQFLLFFTFYLSLLEVCPAHRYTPGRHCYAFKMLKVGGWLKAKTPGHTKSLDSLSELAQSEWWHVGIAEAY
jgi:hypothetical protein